LGAVRDLSDLPTSMGRSFPIVIAAYYFQCQSIHPSLRDTSASVIKPHAYHTSLQEEDYKLD
jgi:hypothetical protein